MREIKKGEQWRKGYQIGYDEASKAYGGCTNCYGKGYATVKVQAGNYRVGFWELPPMKFCSCSRGKQLKKLLSK